MLSIAEKQINRVALVIIIAVTTGLAISGVGVTVSFRELPANLLLTPAILLILSSVVSLFLMSKKTVLAYVLITIGLLIDRVFNRTYLGPTSGWIEGVAMLWTYIILFSLLINWVLIGIYSPQLTLRSRYKQHLSWIWLLLLNIWAVISTLSREINQDSIWGVFNLFILTLCFLALRDYFSRDVGIIKPVMIAIFITALFINIVSLPTVFWGYQPRFFGFEWHVGSLYTPLWWSTGALLHNPNALAWLAVYGVGSISILWFEEGMRKYHKWFMFGVIVFVITFLQSASRGSVIASILIFAWAFKRNPRALFFMMFLISILIWVDNWLNLDLLWTYKDLSLINALESSGRIERWNASISLIQDNPVFGIGVRNLMLYLWSSPHNSYIQMALLYGIPATTFMVLFLLHTTISSFIKNWRKPHSIFGKIGLNAIGVVIGVSLLHVFEIGLLSEFNLFNWLFITFLAIASIRGFVNAYENAHGSDA